MNDGQVDLKKLIDEAERETYNPRAKRCWGFHRWMRWREIGHPRNPEQYRLQQRQCVRCGLTKFKQRLI